jgi:hypothetical protein
MAKKRYYQDAKDRKDESKGMKKYEASMRKDSEEYNAKRPMERHGRFSFGSDYSAHANMPVRPVMQNYPPCGYDIDGYYGDDLAGVDNQIDSDARDVRKDSKKGEKY